MISSITSSPSASDATLIADVSAITGIQTIYVKGTGGSDNNSGTSWASAFQTIQKAITYINTQDALAISNNTAPAVYQVWVAKGSYSTTTSFLIPNEVVLFGGFAGTETSPTGRVAGNTTTLTYGSGVINAVTANAAAVIIDGFTISGASGSDGAGIKATNFSDILLFNMQFTSNSATGNGSAIDAENSSLAVMGSTFSSNTLSGSSSPGGAIYATGGYQDIIAYDTFTSNVAQAGNGGAIDAQSDATLSITNDIFTSNKANAGSGGAIYALNNGDHHHQQRHFHEQYRYRHNSDSIGRGNLSIWK